MKITIELELKEIDNGYLFNAYAAHNDLVCQEIDTQQWALLDPKHNNYPEIISEVVKMSREFVDNVVHKELTGD